MSRDLDKLKLLRDGKRQLNANLIKHFADPTLNAQKVRGVFMMAGILGPKNDSSEELLGTIHKNMHLLNVFAHRTRFGDDMSSSFGQQKEVVEKKKKSAQKA